MRPLRLVVIVKLVSWLWCGLGIVVERVVPGVAIIAEKQKTRRIFDSENPQIYICGKKTSATPMQPPDDDPVGRPALDFDDGQQATSRPRYLFLVDGLHPGAVLPLVCDLVAEAGGELLIGSPAIHADQTSLTAPDPRRTAERLAARYVLKAKEQCESTPPIDHVVVSGRDRETVVRTMVETYDISTLVTCDRPSSGIRSILGHDSLDGPSVPETCDSIIVSRSERTDAIESILVPIAGGPHSELAIETGLALARQNDASLELLHSYSADDDEARVNGEEILSRGGDVAEGYERTSQTLLDADDVHEAIIEYTDPFDITVFGAPREGILRQFILGTIPGDVSEEATGTVLIAHRGGAGESWLHRLL